MFNKIFGVLLVVAVIGVIAYAAITSKPAANEDRLSVAASFYPVYFLAKEIGGTHAVVTNIAPAGGEPHDYEPTAQELALIENSDLLVVHGEMEPWAKDLEKNLDRSKVGIVKASEGLLTQEIEEEGEVIADPHVWLSPVRAKQMAEKIEAGFAAADPENAAYYAGNAATLVAKLDQLDSEFKEGLTSCKKKDFITSHAAFGYLASAYGLNQVAISGLSPEEEPSARQLAETADFAKKNDVKVIFFETLISPKLSETVASEIGAQTMVLDPLEGLTDDAIAAGKDYFSVMRENLANLRTALQCTP